MTTLHGASCGLCPTAGSTCRPTSALRPPRQREAGSKQPSLHRCHGHGARHASELIDKKRKELAQDLAQARAAHFGEAVEKSTDALVDSAAAAAQALHMPSEQLQRERKERAEKRAKRVAKRRREETTYKFAALAASGGVTAAAIVAVHYRFTWQLANSGVQFSGLEAALTLLLTFGGVAGMEVYARWAHKALWHDFAPGWGLHKSHHEPRLGPFEANDIFAIINAAPAIGLCLYGFLTPTLLGGLCFGAGLGITLFGMSYMLVHDGIVHKRFPVGPLGELPALKRIAVAHKLHHAERYQGVPWGLFLGPQELEAVGAKAELDRLCRDLDLAKK